MTYLHHSINAEAKVLTLLIVVFRTHVEVFDRNRMVVMILSLILNIRRYFEKSLPFVSQIIAYLLYHLM